MSTAPETRRVSRRSLVNDHLSCQLQAVVRTVLGGRRQRRVTRLFLILAIAVTACRGAPEPTAPAAGEVTGVVTTTGFFGSHAWDGYQVVAAVPVDALEEFFALNVGYKDVPDQTPAIFTMGMDAEQLEQIPGLRLAEVEDSRFVIDGLDEGTEYWFCAGNQTGIREGRVGFDVCNDPDVDVPGSLIAFGPESKNIVDAHDR